MPPLHTPVVAAIVPSTSRKAFAQKVPVLPAPDPLPGRIDGILQVHDVALRKPARKVSAGCRVWNALCAEPVEEGFVVAAQFDILQANSVEHRIVGQVQDMVTFVIRQMALEQMQPLVNLLPQSDFVHHRVDSPDSPAIDRAGLFTHLVMDVAARHDRLGLVAPRLFGIQTTPRFCACGCG